MGGAGALSMSALRTLAIALGGVINGRSVLAPGPGHSAKDLRFEGVGRTQDGLAADFEVSAGGGVSITVEGVVLTE